MKYFTVAVLAWLSACSTPPLNVHQQNQALWAQQRVSSYQYEIDVVCFCPIDFRRSKRITVVDGEIASAVFVDNNEPVPQALAQQQKTIAQWLDDIARMQADGPALLEIEYDTEFGYPRVINSDYSIDIADDELQVTIHNFNPSR
ncbi:DUF6174 domain-containing protein [Salinibius halmophilus]|uniref:DUF6174 domain-containing protein n=1 Tax=Salinibius halmophilus TaxID=1853216 RepID=UPI000E66A56D|nr:DUF6174 domain-containing protein [Salinibius halmophilus]